MKLKSTCCGAEATPNLSSDFFGDTPETQRIGTCYYVCTKCREACDVYVKERKSWTRNPKTQIQPDKRKKIKDKQTNKEIQDATN